MRHVYVTGGFGYKGSVLVPRLLAAGYYVTVLDTQWFGKHIDDHSNLRVQLGDLRDLVALPNDVDAIIHLAGIANDPCGGLDAKLTWEVNVLGTEILADLAVRSKVKQFIFASSASVYGIKGDKHVVETDELCPVSDYNKTKMCAERVLLSYADKMSVQILRPATICGYSPRMRLDVVVNMLTARALKDGVMNLMTPNLSRPHCHIQDVARLYLYLLDRPSITGTFNAGFENQTIRETAELIAKHVNVPIVEGAASMDKRSYRVDSSKIMRTGFAPMWTVEKAIEEMVAMWKLGAIIDDDRCTNLKWMRMHGLVNG